MSEEYIQYDFHRLDQCECGGTYDCFTQIIPKSRRFVSEGRETYFDSEWTCDKCGDHDIKYYDGKMEEIR